MIGSKKKNRYFETIYYLELFIVFYYNTREYKLTNYGY